MKKDMFYNYDHNIINKNIHSELCQVFYNNYKDRLESYAGMQFIYNIKGELLGISTKRGNPIDLRFKLVGDIIPNTGKGVLTVLGIKLDILDSLHDSVFCYWEERNSVSLEDMLQIVFLPVDYNTGEYLLKQDIYKMKLTININETWYTLFDETDGFLEII